MEKQKQNEVQKVPENNKENQLQSLQNIAKVFQSGKVSPEQKQSGIDYLLKFAQVESKYENQKEHIKNDVKYFLEASMQNRLYTHLGEYNIKKFDVDKNGQIDSKEEQDYGNALREAITQIVLLGGINNFSQIHYDSDSKDGFSNADKWLASKIDLGNHILGEKGDKRFAESTLQKLGEISEEELHKMQETKFQPTSKESWKQLGLLLAKEFGDGVEDVLRFLGNIPSGMILIPRYLKYRVDINSSDEVTKTTGEIKIKELTSENTSLVLLDLLGEQGVELIKKLGEMLTSGKQGDIAMMMVTIAGLVALGGGATKLGLNLARKSAVKSARIAGREARVAGETTSRTTRQGLKKGAQKTGKFAEVAGRVDDLVGGAGIGHLTGQFGGGAEKIKNIQESANDSHYHSNFSTEIPESLRAQNPLAWIDKTGEIHYNQTFLEEKFGIKITTENGKTLFDGKSLKDHKQAQEIIDFLKDLKAHEVTHRIFEARGIDRIAVGNRIYSQEEICSIVDGSRKIDKAELEALEKALKEKLGDDFMLLKNGELDADFLRRYDTKMVAGGEDVRRKSEAARGMSSLDQLSDVTISLDERVKIISSLPRKTQEERKFLKEQIIETRKIIETSRQQIVELVTIFEESFNYCKEKGLNPKIEWINTPMAKGFFEKVGILPKNIQSNFWNKFNEMISTINRLSEYKGKSNSELVQTFFKFSPSGNVRINHQELSINFIFDNYEDYKKSVLVDRAYQDWDKLPSGFKRGDVISYPNRAADEVVKHETQHIKFQYMHDKRWATLEQNEIDILRSVTSETLQNIVNKLVTGKLKEILENQVKDEVIAYYVGRENIVRNGDLANYHELYSSQIFNGILENLPQDSGMRESAKNIIDSKYSNYKHIVSNMIDVINHMGLYVFRKEDVEKTIKLLTITPFQEWYKIMPGLTKADFAI